MAFLPLFSGKAYPRGKYYETITLMRYENNNRHIPEPRPARKYCYIVKCGDLQKIFANAGITLMEDERKTPCLSFWNRRHPIEGEEYGVEICQDDNGKPDTYYNPFYIVYRKHYMYGRAQAQVSIYAGTITPDEAIRLDEQLRKHDISCL